MQSSVISLMLCMMYELLLLLHLCERVFNVGEFLNFTNFAYLIIYCGSAMRIVNLFQRRKVFTKFLSICLNYAVRGVPIANNVVFYTLFMQYPFTIARSIVFLASFFPREHHRYV